MTIHPIWDMGRGVAFFSTDFQGPDVTRSEVAVPSMSGSWNLPCVRLRARRVVHVGVAAGDLAVSLAAKTKMMIWEFTSWKGWEFFFLATNRLTT